MLATLKAGDGFFVFCEAGGRLFIFSIRSEPSFNYEADASLNNEVRAACKSDPRVRGDVRYYLSEEGARPLESCVYEAARRVE